MHPFYVLDELYVLRFLMKKALPAIFVAGKANVLIKRMKLGKVKPVFIFVIEYIIIFELKLIFLYLEVCLVYISGTYNFAIPPCGF